jgi:hypothetical protein
MPTLKVGTSNPTVKLMVTSLDQTNTVLRPVNPPDDVPEADHIFTAVTWITEDKLSVIWVNRVQNESR